MLGCGTGGLKMLSWVGCHDEGMWNGALQANMDEHYSSQYTTGNAYRKLTIEPSAVSVSPKSSFTGSYLIPPAKSEERNGTSEQVSNK